MPSIWRITGVSMENAPSRPAAPIPEASMFADALRSAWSACPQDTHLNLRCVYPGFSTANPPDKSLTRAGDGEGQKLPASDAVDWVEVTHPFHPWSGQRFPRQRCVTTGNVQLVRCIVGEATIRCLPRAWTDLRVIDDFERVSAGRALFRMDDLVALRALVDALLDDQQ